MPLGLIDAAMYTAMEIKVRLALFACGICVFYEEEPFPRPLANSPSKGPVLTFCSPARGHSIRPSQFSAAYLSFASFLISVALICERLTCPVDVAVCLPFESTYLMHPRSVRARRVRSGSFTVRN